MTAILTLIWNFLGTRVASIALIVALAAAGYLLAKERLELHSVTTQLAHERACDKDTVCATRAAQEKALADREAKSALDAANVQHQQELAQKQAEVDAAGQRLTDETSALNKQLVQWQSKFQNALHASKQCANWAKEPVQCPVR